MTIKDFLKKANEWNKVYIAIVAIAMLWLGSYFAYLTFAYAVPRHDWFAVCFGMIMVLVSSWACWFTSNMIVKGK